MQVSHIVAFIIYGVSHIAGSSTLIVSCDGETGSLVVSDMITGKIEWQLRIFDKRTVEFTSDVSHLQGTPIIAVGTKEGVSLVDLDKRAILLSKSKALVTTVASVSYTHLTLPTIYSV